MHARSPGEGSVLRKAGVNISKSHQKMEILTSIGHNWLCMEPLSLELTQFKDTDLSFHLCKFHDIWKKSEKVIRF